MIMASVFNGCGVAMLSAIKAKLPITKCYYSEIDKYAKGGNILIDDKPNNIAKWIDKGGIGILYQANENSLDYLYKQLNKHYEV